MHPAKVDLHGTPLHFSLSMAAELTRLNTQQQNWFYSQSGDRRSATRNSSSSVAAFAQR